MSGAGAGSDLARLLDPIGIETFLSEYWEKAPLYVERADPRYHRELFSLAGVDEILSTSIIGTGAIRIVGSPRDRSLGDVPATGQPPRGLEQVYAQFRAGSTIVLPSVHERWKPLRTLCAGLACELSAEVQINAYMTPRDAQGLDAHYDTHDVLVLQLEGRKLWKLYDSPIRLPLAGQQYQRGSRPLGQPRELELRAGDLLYVPRGVMHEAASLDAISLHLTVGIIPITWAEVVLAAVESMVERVDGFREAVVPGFARDEALRCAALTRLTGLLEQIPSQLRADDLLADAVDRAAVASKPVLDGHLLDLQAASTIDIRTLVRRRDGMAWQLTKEGDDVILQFHGKKLRMPGHVEQDLRWIAEADTPFSGIDLPGGLAADGRLVLVRRLLREGFLSVAAVPAGCD